MKVCPFCDFENEDSASKCEACGTQLTETECGASNENDTNTAVVVGSVHSMADGSADGSAGGYAVVLSSAGKNKIAVIKEIKEHFGCGLAEAKQKSESALVAKGMTQEDAMILADRLGSVGATVEVTEDENVQDNYTQDNHSQSNTRYRSTEIKVSKDLVVGLVIGITVLIGIILVLLVS